MSGNRWRFATKGAKDWVDLRCPYGVVGTRLWVRETHGFPGANLKSQTLGLAERYSAVWYRATDPYGSAMHHGPLRSLHWEHKWRPSIHMPKWATRIWLEVTDVRVERVQEITDQDIEAEGGSGTVNGKGDDQFLWFRDLWNAINAKRGYGWADNPWVFVVSFRRAAP